MGGPIQLIKKAKPQGHVNRGETRTLFNPKTEGREILTIADLSLCKMDIQYNPELSFIIVSLSLPNISRKKAFKENESRWISYYSKCKWLKPFY